MYLVHVETDDYPEELKVIDDMIDANSNNREICLGLYDTIGNIPDLYTKLSYCPEYGEYYLSVYKIRS